MLLNGVLNYSITHLLLALFVNLDFFLAHMTQYDIIVLPVLVPEIFGFMFSIFFLHFKQ